MCALMRKALVFLALAAAVLAQDPIEQQTEQLAYALQDLSSWYRHRKRTDFARHFAARVLGESTPGDTVPVGDAIKGIETRRWVARKPFENSRKMFVQRLKALIRSHGRVHDVAFAPVSSRLENDRLIARVKFFVVAENPVHGRQWSRGYYRVVVEQGKITEFILESGATMQTKRPWLVDATPPEMRAKDPAVLDHPTLGLAAYGAAAADVNGDGRIDILSTGHDTNRLYLNQDGDRFTLVEVKTPRRATAPLFIDIDNDGDPDLFCSADGKQMLLENRDGKFHDISEQAGVAIKTIGFTATAGDINGDHVPDIYVAAYNNYGPVAPNSWVKGTNGLKNLLFVSTGRGKYVEAAEKWGVADSRWSYAAQFADVDGDGKLDLYVANDFGGGNPLYLRRGNRFVDFAAERGVRDDGYSMGVAFGDFDNDGDLDLHLTKMSSKAGNRILDRLKGMGRLRPLAAGNALYVNFRRGHFRKQAEFPAGWAWGGGFIDIDNDGWLDIHSPNGFMSGELQRDT